MRAQLLVALTMFLLVSCGTEPVSFNPDFYEFVAKDGGYITNASKDKKYYCDEPRTRKEFAALHISKIIELRDILRNAKVPKRFKKNLTNVIKIMDNKVKQLQ